MIIVHAVQKLMNISRLKSTLFISEPSAQQELHSWYAKLVSTTFRGKLLVMYVHQPSLIIILTRGKTIAGTMPEFCSRLEAFLNRHHFDAAFVNKEMELVRQGYVFSKTNSKSMLASMNAITENVEYRCSTYSGFEAIDFGYIEDAFMEWLVCDKTKPYYLRRTSDYWRERKFIS